jgi:hypothetical protein
LEKFREDSLTRSIPAEKRVNTDLDEVITSEEEKIVEKKVENKP